MRKIPDVTTYEHMKACMELFLDAKPREPRQKSIDEVKELIKQQALEVFNRVPASDPALFLTHCIASIAAMHMELLLEGYNTTGVPAIKEAMWEVVREDYENSDVSGDGEEGGGEGNVPQSPSRLHN